MKIRRHSFISRTHQFSAVFLILATVAILTGCDKVGSAVASLPTPEVTVATPTEQELTDYEQFTGRTEAIEQIEVRPRVGGHLMKIHFEPGAEVDAGQLLFEIDARPFEAEVERTEAEIARDEARIKRLTAELERSEKLVKKDVVTQEDYDKAVADLAESKAILKATQAKQTANELNLEFTKIEAPIAGKIGDRLISEGNLVSPGIGSNSLLTTILAVDPIYVAFDLDEITLQRIQQAVRDGKIASQKDSDVPIEFGLPIHGTEFPLKGTVKFLNNTVDPKTGTLKVKAICENPMPEDVKDRVLVPGMYVKVRVPLGDPHAAIMVPERALGSDQGTRFLYTINSKNEAIRLNARIGIHKNEMREILAVRALGESTWRELKPDEKIIVSGLQRVRPGKPVAPKSAA